MRGSATVLGVVVLATLVLSSLAGGSVPAQASASASGTSSAPAVPVGAGTSAHPAPSSAAGQTGAISSVSSAFDQRVHETATALAAAGVPARSIRLPYVGASAQIVDGAVVPGPAVAATNVTMDYPAAPAPLGVAYYGENDTSGKVEATTVGASSVAGSLTVNEIDALYLDVDTPDMWGIQLNAVLADVTLHGTPGYEFWVQNAVDVFQHNDTINLGEDTWNFSSATAVMPTDTSTVLSHSPNGSVVAGTYVGEGPWIYAPLPFTLTLYVNSSVTSAGDQKLWYNYSLLAAGGIHAKGNYDWLIFNTGGSSGAGIAPFVADGTQIDPVGLPNDFEFDIGIGGYNGASMDILSANLSATLDYCPVAIASCTPSEFRSVPAAESFGGETGETAVGLFVAYTGTTAYATAGPAILRGLWGFSGGTGAAAGASSVTNAITVAGAPDPGSAAPYVFVFLSTRSQFDPIYEWAPDVPVWYLAPGVYDYIVMLADYAEQTGAITVPSGAPTTLTVQLSYDRSAGVYTPLWATSDAQLAGISASGSGTVADQYLLFNNPTYLCSSCGGAKNGNLSPLFFNANDFLFPTFPGILLNGTDAYVEINATVSFDVFSFSWGLTGNPSARHSLSFYLQIELVSTEHVTLAHDALVGGWPAMYETSTLAGVVNASVNPFPQANVMIWNSSYDLVMEDNFVSTITVPEPSGVCKGVCPLITCYGCISPDGLLLYGGSHNTIWGNTFRDPSRAATTTYDRYGGLAEAESGDLIYNNNFSTDNPTIYLPFDIYVDACPDGMAGDCGPLVPPVYADTWNVPSQPATAVSATVNGFALSGNVLGPTCPTQGGNYWSTYGNALNPTSTVPFVDSYNYAEIASILPIGSPVVQASIRSGGDYLPLTRAPCLSASTFPLRFHASGLPSGETWSLQLSGGYFAESSGRWINVTVASGTVDFTLVAPVGFGVARVGGPHAPTFSSASVTGPTTLTVKFGPLETLTFVDVISAFWPGLPAGASWSVTLTSSGHGGPPSQANSTTGTSVSFSVAQGTVYQFAVTAPKGYQVWAGRGIVSMPGHALTKLIKIRLRGATVFFEEHGLAPGTSWSVTLTPTSPAGSPILISGTSSTLVAILANGTYSYTIPSAGSESPIVATGTLVITNWHTERVIVRFA